MNGYLRPYGGIFCMRVNENKIHWGFNFLVKWSKGGIEVWERIG